MKALLDGQLSPQTATLLRQAGYDADSVADRKDLTGRSDLEVLEAAGREGRAVVTNKHQGLPPARRAMAAPRPSSRRTDPAPLHPHAPPATAIAAGAGAIETVLRDNPDGLTGSERWIGPLPNP